MSSEWRTASLLDHYEVRSGLSKPAKDFGSGYPFLTFKDVFYNYFTPEHLGDFVQSTEKEREGCSILRGDVFLTRTSETMHELGMSCVALRSYKDATFNGFCKRLRPKPSSELLPEYVGYYLRSPVFRQAVSAMSTMSTRASLNNEMIGRLEISFPPREVQVRISEILKSLDDRITLLRETNFTLEAIAQALFKSWFVDFNPVRAKAEGRQPEGMGGDTAALFPDSFEKTELGLIPKGWEITSLGSQCSLAWGNTTITKKSYVANGAKAYSAAGQDGFVEKAERSGIGSVISAIGTVGNVHLAFEDWTAIKNTLTAQCDSDEESSYIHLLLRNVDFPARGSTQQFISLGDAKGLKVISPPIDVKLVFGDIVFSLIRKIVENQKQAIILTQLRDTLLPRLISGQLRLPDAEQAVSEALA